MFSESLIKIFLMALVVAIDAQRNEPKPVEWIGGTFDWPSETIKNMYRNSGRFVSKNIIATRAIIYKDAAILAMPRFKEGVPATLVRMSLKNGKPGSQPILEPFPSWSFQEEDNCASLQSVVDIFVDHLGILWALDTGVVNSLDKPIRKCPAKVVAINLKTGKVQRSSLASLTTSSSRLQYVVADYGADGRVFVYVTDAASGAILVQEVTSGRGYRLVLPKGVTFGAEERDVLYAVLVRRATSDSSALVFTYLSGERMFSIRTEYLHSGSPAGKIHDLGVKDGKMVILGTDDARSIFFRYESDSDVFSWNSNESFDPSNFKKVSTGNEYTRATHVMPDNKRGRMRVLESNFFDFIRGTVGCGVNHLIDVLY